MHQRDVFADLTRLFKERKLHDAFDFEWLKQIRFNWQPNTQDQHGNINQIANTRTTIPHDTSC